MILDRVTLTGADDSVEPRAVVDLALRYPFSEWGILFAGSSQGIGRHLGDGSRFPSFKWVDDFLKVAPPEVNLCAHLCGHYVYSLFANDDLDFLKISDFDPSRFGRIQINFHGVYIPKRFGDIMIRVFKATGKQFVFQVDGVNDRLIRKWVEAGCGWPLFDTSGGAGVTPDELGEVWPTAWPNTYCGYAGGLGPHNVVQQVTGVISQAAGNSKVWIDMETQVRSDGDHLFDLSKCEEVLKAVEPHITKESHGTQA